MPQANETSQDDKDMDHRMSSAESQGEQDLTSDSSDNDNEKDWEEVNSSESSRAETVNRNVKKRYNADRFAQSMSKILDSKLTSRQRADAILSRSTQANKVRRLVEESKLEARARHKLRSERRATIECGRIRDIHGLDTLHTSTAALVMQERNLRRIAQRGVVRLFNAIRAAQIRGEQAAQTVHDSQLVGHTEKQKAILNITKEGFLDMISSGSNLPPR